MKYITLIRGINVGGKNIIKMVELKQLFEKLGMKEVSTYIQSGNVIFSNPGQEGIKQKIEEALSDNLKDDIKITLLTAADIKSIIHNKPENFGTEPDKYKYDIIFMIEPVTPKEAMNTIRSKENIDYMYDGEKVLYIRRLKEGLHFPNLIKLPIYKNLTIRNWNTTVKLYSILN